MGLFLLTPIQNPDRLAAKVAERFGVNAYMVQSTHAWVIDYNGTAKELSDELGITNGSVGTGVIVSIGTYYGRASPDMWEWMKVRLERS